MGAVLAVLMVVFYYRKMPLEPSPMVPGLAFLIILGYLGKVADIQIVL